MNKAANIALALVAGIVVGSVVNSAIVNIGPSIIPLPEGADVSSMEGLAESMHLFKPINFLPPFLAHAMGALVGGFLAARIARVHKMRLAMIVGGFNLMGGITAVVMFGGPLWFIVADLVLAYFPMVYLGAYFAGATKGDLSGS